MIQAGLSKARVTEIAEIEARSAEAEGTDAMPVPEALHGRAEATPPGDGPGRPCKTADYRELVASILTAQPGLKTLEMLRRVRWTGNGRLERLGDVVPRCAYAGVPSVLPGTHRRIARYGRESRKSFPISIGPLFTWKWLFTLCRYAR